MITVPKGPFLSCGGGPCGNSCPIEEFYGKNLVFVAGGNGPEWDGRVGFAPTVLEETAPSADNTVALICGPPMEF